MTTRLSALEGALATIRTKRDRITAELDAITTVEEQLVAEIDTERDTQVRLAALGALTREAAAAEYVHDPGASFDAKPTIHALAHLLEVDIEDVLSQSRDKSVTEARAVIAWVLHKRGNSSVETGTILRRDHSTILHAIRRVEQDHRLHTRGTLALANLERITAEAPALTVVPDAS